MEIRNVLLFIMFLLMVIGTIIFFTAFYLQQFRRKKNMKKLGKTGLILIIIGYIGTFLLVFDFGLRTLEVII